MTSRETNVKQTNATNRTHTTDKSIRILNVDINKFDQIFYLSLN